MDNPLFYRLMLHLLYTQSLCEVILENQAKINKQLNIPDTKDDLLKEVRKRAADLKEQNEL